MPDGMPVLEAGAHRDARSGSCLMEYVSVLAGERFTDRPGCTHPAVAALAWQVNDAVSHAARQELGRRAVDLVGAGRESPVAVRPLVLDVIAEAGLALDPDNRFFPRLLRRLARRPARSGADGTGGRLATLLHVGPVNHACAHLLVATRVAGLDAAGRDRVLLDLLDACLAAVHGAGATVAGTTGAGATGEAATTVTPTVAPRTPEVVGR